jgi:hypothetical protein
MRIRALLAVLLVASTARADFIGLYAPSAPFSGPVARLDFVAKLATELGPTFTGRAYARAADFAAAVKRGELSFAVVDAAYLAAIGAPYRVLAIAQRGGATEAAWEVVTSTPAQSLIGLRGKTVAVPDIGARAEAFVHDFLLEGELPRDFFGRVTYAPDSLSALAAVERGRADAAIVPSGLTLPAGTRRVATLRALSWPVLVALPGAGGIDAVTAAAVRVRGEVLEGFLTGGGAAVQALAGQLGRVDRRAPFLAPPLRLPAADLVGGARGSIQRTELTEYLVDPTARAPVRR